MPDVDLPKDGKSSNFGQFHPGGESDVKPAATSPCGKVPHISPAKVVSSTKSDRSTMKKMGQEHKLGKNRLGCDSINLLCRLAMLVEITK